MQHALLQCGYARFFSRMSCAVNALELERFPPLAVCWPAGQITSVSRNPVKPQIKNTSLYKNSDLRYQSAQPVPTKGDATRSSRNVGAGCDGRCCVRCSH